MTRVLPRSPRRAARTPPRAALWSVALTLLALAAAPPTRAEQPEPDHNATPRGRTPFVLLDLCPTGREVIGVHVTAQAIRDALALVPPDEPPALVILKIDSRGGMLREVPRISDLITNEIDDDTRVVAWSDAAISAAALAALSCPEIVMEPGGTLGAAVTYAVKDGRPTALTGEELDRALQVGAEVARRTGRDPRLVRAMQTPTPLSYDLESDAPVLRDDTSGQFALSDDSSILTLNSERAVELGVAVGTATSAAQLLHLLEIDRPIDVGRFAQASIARHVGKSTRALHVMIALNANVRNEIAQARVAKTDAQRTEHLTLAMTALEDLEREAAESPDVAEYLGIDSVTLDVRQLEITELHAPIGNAD